MAVAAIPFIRARAAVRDIDFLGVITLVAGLTPILVGLSFIGQGYSAASALVLALLLAVVVMLAVFALVEVKLATHPIIPFGIFRTNQIAVMVTVGYFSAFAMSAAPSTSRCLPAWWPGCCCSPRSIRAPGGCCRWWR